MPIDSNVLQTEITTDPRGYGYRALISTDEGGTKNGPTQDADVAALINTVRDGTNPPTTPTADGGAANGAITIRKSSIGGEEAYQQIDMADMTALPATPTSTQLSVERRQLAWITGLPAMTTMRLQEDDASNTPMLNMLIAIFPAGSGTRTRLIALSTRFGSRSEEKFGQGTTVQHLDVARALGRF